MMKNKLPLRLLVRVCIIMLNIKLDSIVNKLRESNISGFEMENVSYEAC